MNLISTKIINLSLLLFSIVVFSGCSKSIILDETDQTVHSEEGDDESRIETGKFLYGKLFEAEKEKLKTELDRMNLEEVKSMKLYDFISKVSDKLPYTEFSKKVISFMENNPEFASNVTLSRFQTKYLNSYIRFLVFADYLSSINGYENISKNYWVYLIKRVALKRQGLEDWEKRQEMIGFTHILSQEKHIPYVMSLSGETEFIIKSNFENAEKVAKSFKSKFLKRSKLEDVTVSEFAEKF